MLQLRKRPGRIGVSIGGRRELHGEEPVPFMDVPIAILITTTELNQLMGDPHTADAWFSTDGGKLAEPLLKNMKPYKLKGKFKNSSATFTLGVNSLEVPMKGVTFATLGFEPQVGGMTQLKLKIQSPITNKNNEMFLWMDRDADIELQFGELELKEVQGDLDLEGGGAANENASAGPNDGEDDEDSDDVRDATATLEDALAADALCAHGNPMGEDCDQCDASKIGTPEEERKRAHAREREIIQRIEADRNADKPKRGRRKASDGAVIN